MPGITPFRRFDDAMAPEVRQADDSRLFALILERSKLSPEQGREEVARTPLTVFVTRPQCALMRDIFNEAGVKTPKDMLRFLPRHLRGLWLSGRTVVRVLSPSPDSYMSLTIMETWRSLSKGAVSFLPENQKSDAQKRLNVYYRPVLDVNNIGFKGKKNDRSAPTPE